MPIFTILLGNFTQLFFFSIKTDDETTILVVYDIYFINQLLKNDNNKNKQTNTNKLKTNRKQTSKNKQTNKQSQKRKKNVQLKSYTKVYYICICLRRPIRMEISTFVKQYYVCFK